MFVLCFQIFVVAGGLAGCGSSLSDRSESDLSILSIKTGNGQEHVFRVELALDAASQARGLMFRRKMADDGGMLFVYDREHVINMWMKNTFLPLDMLFAGRDGTIIAIAKRAEPFSEKIISSQKPAFAVLEVNAGTAERLSIRVGDHIVHPLLSAPAQ